MGKIYEVILNDLGWPDIDPEQIVFGKSGHKSIRLPEKSSVDVSGSLMRLLTGFVQRLLPNCRTLFVGSHAVKKCFKNGRPVRLLGKTFIGQ